MGKCELQQSVFSRDRDLSLGAFNMLLYKAERTAGEMIEGKVKIHDSDLLQY